MRRNPRTTWLLTIIGLVLWWCLPVIGNIRGAAKLLRAVDENRFFSLSGIQLPFGPKVTLLRTFDAQQKTLHYRLISGELLSATLGRSSRGEFAIWESAGGSTRLHLVDPLTLSSRVVRELPFLTSGSSCSFTADGKWLAVEASSLPNLELLLLSSDTLDTVDSIEVPEGAHYYQLGSNFYCSTSQLIAFNEGKFNVVPFAFGSQGAVNDLLSASGSAILIRTTDWTDASGKPLPPLQMDEWTMEDEAEVEATDDSAIGNATTEADDPFSRIERLRHFIHWPLEHRSLKIPNELLGRDTMLLNDGALLATYDRGLTEEEMRRGDRDSSLIIFASSGEEIKRFTNPRVALSKPVVRIWEALMAKAQVVLANGAEIVRAADGVTLARIDNAHLYRRAHWAFVILTVAWCVAWIWPYLGHRQTLVSVGGVLLMALALYDSFWMLFIDRVVDWFLTIYPLRIIVPSTFALWWLFASDWPLQRRLAALLLMCALAWELSSPMMAPYQVLSTFALLAAGTLVILVQRARVRWKRGARSAAERVPSTFVVGDLFLWTTCIGVWMYCAATPRWAGNLEWPHLFKLVVLYGLTMGGSLLIVFRSRRQQVLGALLLLLACGIDLWRSRSDLGLFLLEEPCVYLQALLLAVLVIGRAALWLMTNLKRALPRPTEIPT